MEGSLRILVSVTPDALTRVIVHLLRNFPEIEIVSCVRGNEPLVRQAQRLLPHIIIVNCQEAVSGCGTTVDVLKNASPGSKLILTSWGDDFAVRRRLPNVDAHINEASLVRKLVPTVRKLCAAYGHSVSRRSNQRRYR